MKKEEKKKGRNKYSQFSRKGIVGPIVVFIAGVFVLLFIFGVATPMLIQVNSYFYQAGEDMLQDVDLSNIHDSQAKYNISNSLNQSLASIPQQIDILSLAFQYSWLIILLVLFLGMFMYSRTLVEENRGGIA